VDRETGAATQPVQDAETAIIQEQEYMRNVEQARLTTTKPKTTFEEAINSIGSSLSDFASCNNSDDGEDKDDDEEDTELGKMCKDEQPGWVMGTISKMVQHPKGRVRQRRTRLDKLTQPG
jgi:hypothetical protein